MTTVPSQLSALMRCTALKLGVTVANNKFHNFNSGTLCCRWNWKSSLSSDCSGKLTSTYIIFTHLDRDRTRFVEFMDGLYSEVPTFYEPIKKTRVDFFRQEPRCVDTTKQNVLKHDCQLFSKLFISCQSGKCDLCDLFRQENHPFPAALSDGGKLHTTRQKSQLAAVVGSHVTPEGYTALVTLPDNEPQADVIVIGGSTLVNVLPPRTSKTFEDYETLDVLPTILAYSIKYERTDIMFDVYRPSSMKAEARSKRGHGARRRVTSRCKGPSNWCNFLREMTTKPIYSISWLTQFNRCRRLVW